MNTLAEKDSSTSDLRQGIWAENDALVFPSKVTPEMGESLLESEDSGIDEEKALKSVVRSEQEIMISEAGNMDKIIDLVSNFWDDITPAPRRYPSEEVIEHPLLSFLENSDKPAQRVSESAPDVAVPPTLTNNVRMLTFSDALPRPNLPVPPPPQLPDLSASPLELIAAASGGNIDLPWLETFDNPTLEALVPRDPHTGRPLTVGSLEHNEGKCRPCIFFLRAKCFKGLRCTFCHYNHQGLRRTVSVDDNELDLHSLLFPSGAASSGSSGKSKRLRPSKRTREMIKQINEQMLFGDIQEDPNGPALSITQIPQ